jgi:hypothetical protein
MFLRSIAALIVMTILVPASASGQAPEDQRWHVMQDAVVFGLFNRQGGPRGGSEFKVPNWWMGMFSRKIGASNLTINTMLSLDPLTVSNKGYREIFQVGETYKGKPLIDYQHPHDGFMQLAAVWRRPITDQTSLTLAGGPSAEPAIGPVAFMHRASAIDNPMAPLSHHTFDSTHIAFGVVTAAVDRGPWMIEASLFNGREPDEHRWDFDFGALDSVAGRMWFRPRDEWEFQLSSARLKNPEELGHGNVLRTTASGSWLKRDGEDFTAVTAAYGVNAAEDIDRASWLVEATRRRGVHVLYARAEAVGVETSTLLDDPAISHAVTNTVAALTLGGVRDLPSWHDMQAGIGAAVTFYGVPAPLEVTHGRRPVSFQVFIRLRPAAGAMGRMWNMHMIKPMRPSADPHAGHHMN